MKKFVSSFKPKDTIFYSGNIVESNDGMIDLVISLNDDLCTFECISLFFDEKKYFETYPDYPKNNTTLHLPGTYHPAAICEYFHQYNGSLFLR